MVHIEYMYVCLVAPLLLMLIFTKGDVRRFGGFLIAGMTVCMLAGFINTFIVELAGMLQDGASRYYITPITEEIFKSVPIIFYAAFFTKKRDALIIASLAVGVGFATLENCYYLVMSGNPMFLFALVRGFAAGIMHAVCTAAVGYGISFVYLKAKLAYTGTFALLCLAITYHAVYNMLVSNNTDVVKMTVGCLLPLITIIVVLIVRKKLKLSKAK